MTHQAADENSRLGCPLGTDGAFSLAARYVRAVVQSGDGESPFVSNYRTAMSPTWVCPPSHSAAEMLESARNARTTMAAMGTFSWSEIDENWLVGTPIAAVPDLVVGAFNQVESYFGREWLESSKIQNSVSVTGAHITLHLVALGCMLGSLSGASGTDKLLGGLRARRPDAWAELLAIHLVRSGAMSLDLEVEPAATVKSRTRVPDLRVACQMGDWTYVEVTRPSTSKTQDQVRLHAERLAHIAEDANGNFALEVFLHREPARGDVEVIADMVKEVIRLPGPAAVNLPFGLGALYLNASPPGTVTHDSHGLPYTPRLGLSSVVVGDGVARHISVRWPFTDTRAEEFLRKEARQLPKDAPGLIMINTSAAVGSMKAWRALIERRLQPSQHTRVSGVCLYSAGFHGTERGEEWRPQAKLIANLHAQVPLPGWIQNQLDRFPSDEPDLAM